MVAPFWLKITASGATVSMSRKWERVNDRISTSRCGISTSSPVRAFLYIRRPSTLTAEKTGGTCWMRPIKFRLAFCSNSRFRCDTGKVSLTGFSRSKESVKRLGAVNKNSIENSAHLKGKTFDINYRAFDKNKKQNKAFIKVLNDLRLQGKCYVKYERNGCLHITVI